jgi:hypothetical protein
VRGFGQSRFGLSELVRHHRWPGILKFLISSLYMILPGACRVSMVTFSCCRGGNGYRGPGSFGRLGTLKSISLYVPISIESRKWGQLLWYALDLRPRVNTLGLQEHSIRFLDSVSNSQHCWQHCAGSSSTLGSKQLLGFKPAAD